MNAYILISPRGFRNETIVYIATPEQIEAADYIINGYGHAWAHRVPASHPEVRRAKRLADKSDDWDIPVLTREDLPLTGRVFLTLEAKERALSAWPE